MRQISFLIALSFLFLGSALPAGADDYLTQEELREFHKGLTVDMRSRNGDPMTLEFHEDGSMTLYFERVGNPVTARTEWWVTDTDATCFSSPQGTPRCYKLRKVGDGYERYNLRGVKLRSHWQPRS